MKSTNGKSDILLVRNDRLGDTILSLPTVTALKKWYPNKKIHFLSAPFIAPLMNCIEGIDTVISAPDYGCSISLKQLQKLPIQTAFCLRPTLSNVLTLFRAGIPERVGTSRRLYSSLFTHRINQSRRDSNKHEADLNLELLEEMGITGTRQFPPIQLPKSVTDKVDKLLELNVRKKNRPIIIIHPGSGGSAREWSVRYFQIVADTLSKEIDVNIIVTGSPSELEKCSIVGSNNHADLSGKTDLLELTVLIQKADLFISNSTGPLHLAGMIGTKVIGIYPPIQDCLPSRWGPYTHPEQALMPDLPICQKCHPGAFSSCECLENLLPATVIQKAVSLLQSQ